jgi:mannose-6-phosphate isomerase-like protein (cupin superfamily)
VSAPIDELRRKLAVYRTVLGAVALLAGAFLLFRRGGARDGAADVRVIDLGAEIAEIERTRSDVSDLARWYTVTGSATVHMHLLGPHQIVPLHIHRKSNEATFIVSGSAKVTHVFGAGGSERKTTDATPGTLVVSPPLSGHAWKNVEPGGGAQANLVFEVPPFDGNLYLDDSDLARADGPAPIVYDVPAQLAEFVQSSDQVRTVPLPLPEGRLAELFVKSEATLPVDPDRTLVLYVAGGKGEVESRPLRARVAARSLVLVSGPRSVTLHPATPMAVLVFHP